MMEIANETGLLVGLNSVLNKAFADFDSGTIIIRK
jgi:hypothetical protein